MIKAKKSLGQNFLKDPLILNEIIRAANLSPSDIVLEIGPGKGVLTQALIDRAAKVIAVELDQDLLPVLQNRFGSAENFELVHQDALKFTPPTAPYKIVANIPYYITSPLLNHFLLDQFTNGNPPEMIVFMVQKEVAEKIIAANGKHSVLSLQVHMFGEPEMVCIVPREAFEPAPKVESAVIKIRIHEKPQIQSDLKKIFWLIHMCFAQKRKKLTRNLANAFKKKPAEMRTLLEQLKINPDVRAENLTLKEWHLLVAYLEPQLLNCSNQ
jgi:16S rRNA (adenine1518-N6/adenine1519-N6)-dimethyltransferase